MRPDVIGAIALVFAVALASFAISGQPVIFFYSAYFCLIAAISLVFLSRARQQNSELVLFACVLGTLWVFQNIVLGNPVQFNSDLQTEFTIASYIVQNGTIPRYFFGFYAASVYSSYPALEIVSSSLQIVSGIPAQNFFIYGGAFLSAIQVFLIYSFFRKLFQNYDFAFKATIIATFSAAFISYGALAIHETLALLFFWCILCLWVQKQRRLFHLTFILLGGALVISHDLTPILFAVFLIFYSFGAKWMKKGPLPIFDARIIFAYLVFLFSWIFLGSTIAGLALTNEVSGYLGIFQRVNVSVEAEALAPTGTKAFWVTSLSYLGFAIFGIIAIIGIFGERKKYRWTMPLLVGAAPIIAVLLAYNFIPYAASGILERGLLYVYFFAAPVFVLGFTAMSLRVKSSRVICFVIIFLALAPTLLYSLPAPYYSSPAPLRLSTGETYASTVFSLSVSGTGGRILAAAQAFGMINGIDPAARKLSSVKNLTAFEEQQACGYAIIAPSLNANQFNLVLSTGASHLYVDHSCD